MKNALLACTARRALTHIVQLRGSNVLQAPTAPLDLPVHCFVHLAHIWRFPGQNPNCRAQTAQAEGMVMLFWFIQANDVPYFQFMVLFLEAHNRFLKGRCYTWLIRLNLVHAPCKQGVGARWRIVAFRFCGTPGRTSYEGLCSAGYFCPEGSFVTKPQASRCPAGKMCPAGSAEPIPCDPTMNQYQPSEGQESCQTCPPGFTCTAESATLCLPVR